MTTDSFSKYLVESTVEYFDRYGKMYGQSSLDEEFFSEEVEDELEAIIEELLDEGYSIEECVEIFEELDDEEILDLLDEAIRLTPKQAKAEIGARKAARREREQKAARSERVGAARQQRKQQRIAGAREGRKAERKQLQSAKRAEKISAVKRGVKGKVLGALAAGQVSASSAKAGAKQKLQKAKQTASRGYSTAAQAGSKALTRAREKGSAAKAHAASGMAKAGKAALNIAKGVRKQASAAKAGAKFYGREIPGAAQSAGRMAKGAVTSRASAAKTGLKQKIGKALMKGAKRMGVTEEMDIYDVVLNYLIDNDYAVSFQEAYEIMAELDDDTIDSILEETGFEFIED